MGADPLLFSGAPAFAPTARGRWWGRLRTYWGLKLVSLLSMLPSKASVKPLQACSAAWTSCRLAACVTPCFPYSEARTSRSFPPEGLMGP